MDPLLIILIKQIVVPELAHFVHQRFAETGKPPTKEEMEARILLKANEIIKEGEAFLTRVKGISDDN